MSNLKIFNGVIERKIHLKWSEGYRKWWIRDTNGDYSSRTSPKKKESLKENLDEAQLIEKVKLEIFLGDCHELVERNIKLKVKGK